MVSISDDRIIRQRFGGSFSVSCMLAAVVFLSGCSDVPDYANPVEWYKSASDVVTGDGDETGTQTAQAIPGENKPYPTLGTKTQRPASKGLVADTDRPRYASQPITRQGAAANALGQAPAPQTAPPPVPRVPITAAPSAAPKPAQMAQAPVAPSAPRPALVKPSEAMPTMPKLAELAPMTQSGPFETVVISGDGVEFNASASQQVASASGAAMAQNQSSMVMPKFGYLAVARTTEQGLQKVATIHFVSGSSTLDARDQAVLHDVAALMKQKGGKRMVVVGHASSRTRNMDPVRHAMVNYQMSVARANAVSHAVSKLGIDPNVIAISARSDREPTYFEVMPSGEAGNRRADVYIEY